MECDKTNIFIPVIFMESFSAIMIETIILPL